MASVNIAITSQYYSITRYKKGNTRGYVRITLHWGAFAQPLLQ